ncbi:hypothetical protein D3C77_247630 [compost metagenome]
MAALGAFALGRLAHGLDGVGVDLLIAFGIGGGAGPLAQHVEAAQPVFALRTLERALDGAADDELLAHDLHGGGDGLADDRLAQAAGDALEEARQVGARLLVDVDQLAGQHQPPGRGVDEQAVRLAQVRGPIGRADLLGDQAVAGVGVGGAQQGLGQAHQGQTFAGAQAELLQEAFDHALTLLALARALDQADRVGQHRGAAGRIQRLGGQEFSHHRPLIAELVLVQLVPMAKVSRSHENPSRGITAYMADFTECASFDRDRRRTFFATARSPVTGSAWVLPGDDQVASLQGRQVGEIDPFKPSGSGDPPEEEAHTVQPARKLRRFGARSHLNHVPLNAQNDVRLLQELFRAAQDERLRAFRVNADKLDVLKGQIVDTNRLHLDHRGIAPQGALAHIEMAAAPKLARHREAERAGDIADRLLPNVHPRRVAVEAHRPPGEIRQTRVRLERRDRPARPDFMRHA